MNTLPTDIALETAVAIPDPKQGYDRVKFWLSISPMETPAGVDYVASIRVVPYRTVDGRHEEAPASMHRSVAIGSAATEIVQGGQYARPVGAILQVMQQALVGFKLGA